MTEHDTQIDYPNLEPHEDLLAKCSAESGEHWSQLYDLAYADWCHLKDQCGDFEPYTLRRLKSMTLLASAVLTLINYERRAKDDSTN